VRAGLRGGGAELAKWAGRGGKGKKLRRAGSPPKGRGVGKRRKKKKKQRVRRDLERVSSGSGINCKGVYVGTWRGDVIGVDSLLAWDSLLGRRSALEGEGSRAVVEYWGWW